jgi:hypothetical protein
MRIIGEIKYIGILFLAAVLFTACNNLESKETETKVDISSVAPTIGDHVPNNLVCMVNNAYMGVQQLEVPFEGKMYYGCCEMCQDRIPKEEEVRVAVDLYSLKEIDKADAYIVLVGDRGEVAYFENERNYKQLLAKSNLNKN